MKRTLIIFAFALLILSCKKDNKIPTANAGNDQSVKEGATVSLDGSASSDLDSDALTYKWIAPSGITLSSETMSQQTFTAPEVATDTQYIFSLVVNDGKANSLADEVVITVTNEETIDNNRAYLDFLKDKSILGISIVDDTKYIKSLKSCKTCGPKEHRDTVQWTVVKNSSYKIYLDSDFIGVPIKDNKGNFYVGTYKSLYKLNNSEKYELILNTGDFYFRSFAIDKLDNIWFYGDNAGIAYWNHAKLTVYNSQNSILPANYYCELVVDKSNTLWVASIGNVGLLKIESDKWEIIPGSQIPGFTENSYLNFPLVDDENGIWFEVYDSDADTKFVRLKDNKWLLEYPPANRNLIKDSKNVIWSISSQLMYLDLKENKWIAVDISNIDSRILTVNADDNTIYIGTEQGLFEKSK